MDRNSKRGGFSLIELLAATVILIIIVLIMSNIFHQSSVAWDGGMRRSNGSMMARSVFGMMTRELAGAVGELSGLPGSYLNDSLFPSGSGGTLIRFITLNGPTNNISQRAAMRISYSLSGASIKRKCEILNVGGNYGVDWNLTSDEEVAKNIALSGSYGGLNFVSSTNTAGDLPPWVRVVMEIEKDADVSGVGAKSSGPNKVFDSEGSPTDDDIRSL